MWFRRLVGIAMIISFVGMNTIIVLGLLSKPTEPATANTQQTQTPPPTIKLSAKSGKIAAGSTSSLSWKTTNAPTSCKASGDWNGKKTPFGSESTGRLKDVKTYTYILECTNAGGSAKAKVSIKVSKSVAASDNNKPAEGSSSEGTTTPSVTYCGGRVPCYGKSEVATHGSAGNCWGYNGDRVINISGFDGGFHKSKSGLGSIEVGGVCGTDLSNALHGGVTVDGETRNHKSDTTNNMDRNMIPYFVGYYDAAKP